MDLTVCQSLKTSLNFAGVCRTLFSEKKGTGGGGYPLANRLLASQRALKVLGVNAR